MIGNPRNTIELSACPFRVCYLQLSTAYHRDFLFPVAFEGSERITFSALAFKALTGLALVRVDAVTTFALEREALVLGFFVVVDTLSVMAQMGQAVTATLALIALILEALDLGMVVVVNALAVMAQFGRALGVIVALLTLGEEAFRVRGRRIVDTLPVVATAGDTIGGLLAL